MTPKRLSAVVLTLALIVSACDDGSVIRRPEVETDISASALASVRDQLNEEPAPVEAGEIVDPAAQYINPFKPAYSYKERTVYDRLLEQARKDPEYLERSLQATKDSFSQIAIDIVGAPYEEILRRAAVVQASAILGDRMAHEAKSQMIEILDSGIVLKDKSELDELLTRSEYDERLAEFRKRNYLNYFLTLDQVMENGDRESIRTEAAQLVDPQG